MENIEKNEQAVPQEGCGCGCQAAECGGHAEKAEARRKRPVYKPAVDIIESESGIELVMDLPGIEEDSLGISLEKSVLTVKASQAEDKRDGLKLAYAEYGVGEYHRSFTLSEEVGREGISASLKDGVLTIALPKSQAVAKKIEISRS